MKIASLTAVFMAAVGMAAAAPPPPSQSPAAIQRAADTTEAVANYELVLRACLCSPFSAIQTFEDRILTSRSPITLPPLGSFVYLKVGGTQQEALVVWRLTTDFIELGNTVTYRTIVETAPQDILQAANPNLPALGLTSFSIAGPPPPF
jgi:hypothetical protein